MSSLQIAVASYERIQTFLSSEELTEDIHGIKIKKISGRVNFNNVSFSYAPDRQIINNFSIKIPSGAKVAIVGPTGAGKTTIVNLLMRFYDIEKGAIEIDGVDTKLMTRDYLSSLFSMVLQDPWLYKTTIMENIRYTTKNVDDNKVKSICKLINLDHIVKSLPNGYDTIVDDKISLSSGEKQLITIARALVHDAPIVILDEATSNVDTKTEQVIQNAMVELVNNKTAFIIAHRLSTIKNSDIIIVMNNGSIVEYGNHYELLERKQFYANLYNSQFSE
jgi:ATP-binding cassette subfamily B protein